MDSTAKTSVYTIPTIPKCLQSSGLHVVHLVDEVKLGGPVPYRWMYNIERYLGHLKSFVRNRTNPESSIAEGYIAEECLTFCSRYLDGVETRFNRSRRVDDVPLYAENIQSPQINWSTKETQDNDTLQEKTQDSETPQEQNEDLQSSSKKKTWITWEVDVINGEGFVKKKKLKVKEVWTLPLDEQIIVPFDNFGTPFTEAAGLFTGTLVG
nr:uncharacterized protein LOC109173351 [Ipomoea batatas]